MPSSHACGQVRPTDATTAAPTGLRAGFGMRIQLKAFKLRATVAEP